MKKRTLTLSPSETVTTNGWTSVRWALAGYETPGFTLSHAVPDEHAALLVSPEQGDHALVAVLIWAMQHCAEIRVEGCVSPTLLKGLETVQQIWRRWRPKLYTPVDIVPDEESEANPLPGERSGLFAFSGGVDATFTFFRHFTDAAGRNTCKPGAALLVHGMDIPIDREDFFADAAMRAERMLTGTCIPLIRQRTNSRALRMDWEDSFGLQLLSCFLALQPGFSFGIKGSEEPFESLAIPWGSSPLTDPHCSTAMIQMVHDGCSFDRTEKVDWLHKNTPITNDLRVCWAGANLGRNCGECEKCLRTMLNFWAKGNPIPSAFPKPLLPESISRIAISNAPQLAEFQSVYLHAQRQHDRSDPILKALKQLLFRTKLRIQMKKVSAFSRQIARI